MIAAATARSASSAGADFFDIGSPRDYLDTVITIASRERRRSIDAGRCTIATDAADGHGVWDRVVVGAGRGCRMRRRRRWSSRPAPILRCSLVMRDKIKWSRRAFPRWNHVEQYLAEHNLNEQTLKVVPLTGDASDRRYCVLLKNAKPIVLALHADRSITRRCRFCRREALVGGARAGAGDPASFGSLGVIGLKIWGRHAAAHLGASTPTEHDACRQAVDFIRRMQERGEASLDAYPPIASPSTSRS